CIVRIDTDEVELVEILEFGAAEFCQLAAEDEMGQLPASAWFGHRAIPRAALRSATPIPAAGRARARSALHDGHARRRPARHGPARCDCRSAIDLPAWSARRRLRA